MSGNSEVPSLSLVTVPLAMPVSAGESGLGKNVTRDCIQMISEFDHVWGSRKCRKNCGGMIQLNTALFLAYGIEMSWVSTVLTAVTLTI